MTCIIILIQKYYEYIKDTIIYAMMLYEAVWLYAVALNKSLSDGISHYDSINIAKRMFNITFKGIYLLDNIRSYVESNA